ncbi:hypothetical protein GF336_02600 [Candidatus Woesearchaeota archaeon]|nr:hypothetical protein [Candidatus Woesearchaeota archaeon]
METFFVEVIVSVRAFLLATCGLPHMWKILDAKDFNGLSIVFILCRSILSLINES